MDYHGKPYYSLDAYCKNTFGCKCYKIALDAHMTCPNRDGSLDTRGCIFCSQGGSGDFAVDGSSVSEQLAKGLALFHSKKTGDHYIAYFQSYTNTYAPLSRLRQLYTDALSHPQVCGISIATRPDCMGDEVISLLSELQVQFPEKFLWVELGLQTIHEQTALWMRRGYPLSCFTDTAERLKAAQIPFIVHVILGLPGETEEMVLQTIEYLNTVKPFGIKLQLLHVLKYTDLGTLYQQGTVPVLTQEAYLSLLIRCIEHLSPDIVIHRVTGDGPKDLLLAPLWSLNKRNVLNTLHKTMKEQNSYQGRYYHVTGSGNSV